MIPMNSLEINGDDEHLVIPTLSLPRQIRVFLFFHVYIWRDELALSPVKVSFSFTKTFSF